MDVRNARNAVIEALPHMLSSMALLWGVVTREEFQRRACDSAQSSRHASTAVYFKSIKVCVTHMHVFCILPTLMCAMTECALFMLNVFVGLVTCLHRSFYLALCIFYYGKLYVFAVCACIDPTATNTGVSGTSNWAVWGSGHGFTGSSVEQQEE